MLFWEMRLRDVDGVWVLCLRLNIMSTITEGILGKQVLIVLTTISTLESTLGAGL